jgi:gamma-glutamyltranspeptidase/glutathione hydrolase
VPPSDRQTPGIVAAFYDEARDAGLAVLAEGGSAADAFVATTLVQYVRAAGETSLAGPLAALTYDPKTGAVRSLDAGFDAMRDATGLYNPDDPKLGASVLVPGALRGLEALHRAAGRLPWRRVVEPAQTLAQEGFRVDAFYAAAVANAKETLSRTESARALFFPDGQAIAVGSTLRQPELAAFLADIADVGADAMHSGRFADVFVAMVRANGGAATHDDLARYEARWQTPWSLPVRGQRAFVNAGRSYGGVYALLGVAVLANDTREPGSLDEADRLEVRLRTARALYDDLWFFDARRLDNPAFVARKLDAAQAIWAKVQANLVGTPRALRGSHSLQVTVVDREGYAVTGTNTVNGFPWGSGLFVRGVALTDAGRMYDFVQAPGERVVNGLALGIVTKDDALRFVGGSFGSSLLETQLQVMADALFGEPLSARDVAERRRFGTFPFDWSRPDVPGDLGANWIGDDTPDTLVQTLAERGLRLTRDRYADNGWGSFVIRAPDGRLEGATLDASWFRGSVGALADSHSR